MVNKQFRLQYLPSFEDDLNDIVDYIAFKLGNPDAASNFLDDIMEVRRVIYSPRDTPNQV